MDVLHCCTSERYHVHWWVAIPVHDRCSVRISLEKWDPEQMHFLSLHGIHQYQGKGALEVLNYPITASTPAKRESMYGEGPRSPAFSSFRLVELLVTRMPVLARHYIVRISRVSTINWVASCDLLRFLSPTFIEHVSLSLSLTRQ